MRPLVIDSPVIAVILDYFGLVQRAGGLLVSSLYRPRLPRHRLDYIHAATPGQAEMLTLQERLNPVRNTPSSEREELLRQIAHVDAAIDQAVYDLYGLTESERKLVEEAVRPATGQSP